VLPLLLSEDQLLAIFGINKWCFNHQKWWFTCEQIVV
jgi:hypothetical protein